MSENEPKTYVELGDVVPIRVVETARVRMATSMSPLYLWNAAYFTRQAYALETAGQAAVAAGEKYDDTTYRGTVVAAVVFSVFFLEAAIHEYLEINSALPERLEPSLRYLPIQYYWWFTGKSRNKSALERYNDVLSLHGSETIPTNKDIGQDVKVLIEFRNALAHYKPQWEGDGVPVRDVEAALASRVGQRNPFRTGTATRFPNHYLSHGCAEWAVTLVLTFYNLFTESIQAPSRFDPADPILATR